MIDGGFRIRNNCIIAKVNGVRMVLSSGEFQRLIDEGYDVEAVG